MLYFIPAWYQNNQFAEAEQYWYTTRQRSEFDDTVKQVQLFQRSGAFPYRIMLLSFAPNFRHFLHRQSVYRAPYWSCFDAIQEVRKKKAAILSYHNIAWPSGVEFTYTPFVMNAELNGEKYARIEFGEDGNLIEIDMFEGGKLHRKNIYDDRGFVASTILYDDMEKPVYRDFLSENAVWKMRYFYADGSVKINEKAPTYLISYEGKEDTYTFSKLIYASVGDVIYEVLNKYLEYTDENDIFCAACHELHADIVARSFAKRKLILSFFENRYIPGNYPNVTGIFAGVDHFIVDSEVNKARILAVSNEYESLITDITPYDSRVSFGISQQLDVQNILVPIDGIDDETISKLIVILDEYLKCNKNARVHLFTRSANEIFINKINGLVSEYGKYGAGSDESDDIDAITEVHSEKRFVIDQCVSELAVSKCMQEQRIIVDVRDIPELFLQISAISGGIPQIVRVDNQYVTHGKNGHVIEDLSELNKAIDYYLANLNNWNEAKIYCYEFGQKYTTGVLLNRWKEVIKSLGNN